MRPEVDALPPKVERPRHAADRVARLVDDDIHAALSKPKSSGHASGSGADDCDSHGGFYWGDDGWGGVQV